MGLTAMGKITGIFITEIPSFRVYKHAERYGGPTIRLSRTICAGE